LNASRISSISSSLSPGRSYVLPFFAGDFRNCAHRAVAHTSTIKSTAARGRQPCAGPPRRTHRAARIANDNDNDSEAEGRAAAARQGDAEGSGPAHNLNRFGAVRKANAAGWLALARTAVSPRENSSPCQKLPQTTVQLHVSESATSGTSSAIPSNVEAPVGDDACGVEDDRHHVQQ
jgi:hypothetical protein